MKSITHLEKVITGEVSAVTHLERVITEEVAAVTYTEKVIAGTASPITHLQKVIAGEASPVTHLEHVWAGRTPEPTEHEYTGVVPVTFTADGTPLLDYLISGNMEQSGTPTPQNPIQPQETGDKTANLFDGQLQQGYYTYHNGVYVLSDAYVCTHLIPCTENTTYTFRCINTGGGSKNYGYAFFDSSQNRIGDDYIAEQTEGDVVTHTATTPQNTAFLAINIAYGRRQDRVVRPSDITDFMLNTGSTAPSYEPYGYKIPISSASTTTPVYLGEVETTRRINKLVLTGEENITSSHLDVGIFNVPINDYLRAPILSSMCTHYKATQNVLEWSHVPDKNTCFYVGVDEDFRQLYIRDSSYSTISDFKAYLAAQYANGTPVTIRYVLATPETGIVNEPIRKIGDYADTVSKEQAGVQIPTNNGSTTVDVETTLKPSEVYIKYMG